MSTLSEDQMDSLMENEEAETPATLFSKIENGEEDSDMEADLSDEVYDLDLEADNPNENISEAETPATQSGEEDSDMDPDLSDEVCDLDLEADNPNENISFA
ncbi:uncharacterized protein [Amphiura filiformis]|uniref:uncharacterized protein n=1 Tax=Amphiura filiformis TaxID=82378 RepID=UPI003B20F689